MRIIDTTINQDSPTIYLWISELSDPTLYKASLQMTEFDIERELGYSVFNWKRVRILSFLTVTKNYRNVFQNITLAQDLGSEIKCV